LIKEQYALLPALVNQAAANGFSVEPYLRADNYCWVGHSLGCKYIALIEAFGKLPKDADKLKLFINDLLSNIPGESELYDSQVKEAVGTQLIALINDTQKDAKLSRDCVERSMKSLVGSHAHPEQNDTYIYNDLFIKDQSSILLAPVISDTSSAIPKPFTGLARWLDSKGWGVQPTPKVTQKLIRESKLFNLLILGRFTHDSIAKDTIDWFDMAFQKPPEDAQLIAVGSHYRPLGVKVADFVVNSLSDRPLISTEVQRNEALEDKIKEKLQALLEAVR
jgi:hypothetical protein